MLSLPNSLQKSMETKNLVRWLAEVSTCCATIYWGKRLRRNYF